MPPPRRPRASRALIFMSAQDARGPEENDHQLKSEPCGPRLSALRASKPTAHLPHGFAMRHPRSGPPRPPRLVEGLVRRLRWSPRFRGASLATSRVRVPIVRPCRPTRPTESHAAWDGFDADGIGISMRFPIFSALAPLLRHRFANPFDSSAYRNILNHATPPLFPIAVTIPPQKE